MGFKCFTQNAGGMNTFQCWEAESECKTSKNWVFVSINNQQATNFSKVRSRGTKSSLDVPLQVFKHLIKIPLIETNEGVSTCSLVTSDKMSVSFLQSVPVFSSKLFSVVPSEDF